MKVEVYNFRKPSRLPADVEQRLVAWLTASFPLVGEKWLKHLEVPITQALSGVDTVRPVDALAELAEAVVAYRVMLGTDGLQSLIVLPSPLALTLASGILGEACTELSPERSLTPVELSLVEFLLQQFLAAVQESCPGTTPIRVAAGELEPAPRRTRIFKPDENIVRASLVMQGPFGEQSWHWLIPQKGLSELFSQADQQSEIRQQEGVRTRLEALVGTMPLEVRVRLGAAVLQVSELAGLREGDLVLLDQPVGNPLPASVAGKTRFLVWPGRIGLKQAFQIQSMVEC